jgi:hypothetical protein
MSELNDTNSEKMFVPSNKMDKLTMEYLMNKSQYKKYVAKTDPEKYANDETLYQKICKYRNKILFLTEELLENPNKLVTLDVNDGFSDYARTMIRYFEMKEMEKDDNDIIFDKIDIDMNDVNKVRMPDDETSGGKRDDTRGKMFPYVSKSYWGKSVSKGY